jgi:hypothetical protein
LCLDRRRERKRSSEPGSIEPHRGGCGTDGGLTRRIGRDGRGSLRGKLVAADDWDSDEVNEVIARDFGMMR